MDQIRPAAVFLDRDGVINEEDGIVRTPEQLRLIEGSARAVRRLNELDLPVIVVTNQPVVARGWASEAEVDEIHDRLRGLLAEEGARVDAIYFCPHHENADDPNYRVACECRKPRPGLLRQAAEDFDLDLGRCLMIGDRTVDLQAAREAGCAAAWLVETGYGGRDGKCEARPDRTFRDLSAAVAVMADVPAPLRRAVILAAGFGTRLGDLTRDQPKVMVPIAGKPMLEHHLDWLRAAGVREFFLNLHYLPDVITDYFGDGSKWGVSIRYSHEDQLQGTAGSLRAFRDELEDTFLIQYGDVFSRLDVGRFLSFHRANRSAASLVVHPSSHPHDSDIVTLGSDGRIEQIHHKPGDSRFGNLGNAGAYLLEPRGLDFLGDGPEEVDFCRDLFPAMLDQGEALFGYNTDDLLLDVGTPERLAFIEERLNDS